MIDTNLILKVPNPQNGCVYYFGILFRPKYASEYNPEITSWDGMLLSFTFDKDDFETPATSSQNLWLYKLPFIPKTGTLNLREEDTEYVHLYDIKTKGKNYCDRD